MISNIEVFITLGPFVTNIYCHYLRRLSGHPSFQSELLDKLPPVTPQIRLTASCQIELLKVRISEKNLIRHTDKLEYFWLHVEPKI